MDSVSDLQFFRLIVKQGTLSAAAQELGVTPPAVSRRLASLERRLGVRLIHRTARKMIVTPEGERYVEEGSRILDEIESLEQTVASGRESPRGLLRINASFEFGRAHLPLAISDFIRLYPEIAIQLILTDRPMNPIEQGVDLVIRIGELPDTRFMAKKIATNRHILCAAPTYLKARPAPTSPRDLQSHECIIVRQGDAAYGTLHLAANNQHETIKVHGALTCNDPDVGLAWAIDGRGILMTSECDAAPYVRSGRLREVLSDWTLPPGDIFATYPERVGLSAKVRTFIQFMAERFAKQATNGGAMHPSAW